MKSRHYFSADIREFLFLLAKHPVRYLIVGGEAGDALPGKKEVPDVLCWVERAYQEQESGQPRQR